MIAALLRRMGPVWLAAMLAVAVVSAAAADSVCIRNPLWVGAQITNDWSHGSLYGDRALDLVYANGGATGGQGVYWRADNVDATQQVYYEVYDYGTSCTGAKYQVYTHPNGGPPYTFVGTSNYVHMAGYSTGQSYNINPGTSEAYLIGSVATSQPAGCSTWLGAHLHHGHNSADGFFDATWLTLAVATGTGVDAGSEEITLYK